MGSGQGEPTLGDLNLGSPEAETEAGGDSPAWGWGRKGPREKPVEKQGKLDRAGGEGAKQTGAFRRGPAAARPRGELWGFVTLRGLSYPEAGEPGFGPHPVSHSLASRPSWLCVSPPRHLLAGQLPFAKRILQRWMES